MRLRVGVVLGKTGGVSSAVQRFRPKHGESLADLFSDMAAQWHPTKNGDMSPSEVNPGTTQRFWWKCSAADDHEWQVSAVGRTHRSSGCPFCTGRKVTRSNSLATLFPEIAAEWHPTKNGDLTPDEVTSASGKRVWWKCPVADDHEWRTMVANRKFGKDCPCCANQKISITNSLATLFPEIAAEWHPTKNGDLTPDQIVAKSGKGVWWLCGVADDHEWLTSPNERAGGGSGCPSCSGRQVSVTNSLATLASEIAADWHPTKNGALTPVQVVAGAHKKVWWKCPVADDHEWQAILSSRTFQGTGCPCCAHQKLSITNSLATLFPEIAAEWHTTKNGDLTPTDVIAGTDKKMWWKCPVADDHEWRGTPSGRSGARRHGCPQCTLTPRSKQEIQLAHELSALIDFDLEAHKVRFAGRLRDVDIVFDALKLIVEFDGNWWHRNKGDKDREKTALIEEAGWQVIRVRERPLDSIHVNDVMVDTGASAKTAADLVLDKIVEVTGTDVPQLDEYLASEGPWREAEALKAIRAYHAERAAKKAARAKKKS